MSDQSLPPGGEAASHETPPPVYPAPAPEAAGYPAPGFPPPYPAPVAVPAYPAPTGAPGSPGAPGYPAPAGYPAPQTPVAPAGYPGAPAGYPGVPAPAPATPGYYAAPSGAFVGPAWGYTAPPAPVPPASRAPGLTALVLSLVAAVVAPIVMAVAAWQMGAILGTTDPDYLAASANDLRILSPVRTQVLWAEIGFWIGTLTGIAAIVFGIIGIARRRGRGMGITALILAILGPVIAFFLAAMGLALGAAAGLGSTF